MRYRPVYQHWSCYRGVFYRILLRSVFAHVHVVIAPFRWIILNQFFPPQIPKTFEQTRAFKELAKNLRFTTEKHEHSEKKNAYRKIPQ